MSFSSITLKQIVFRSFLTVFSTTICGGLFFYLGSDWCRICQCLALLSASLGRKMA